VRNVALVVSYDGTDYQGYQSQPGGRTIQNKLEEAIRALTGEEVRLIGSGRTDAGVHARCQVVNFGTSSRIPIERWAIALNARLPGDIVVHSAHLVPDDFHSRHGAISKTYRYTINCYRTPDLFRRRYEFHHPTPLNVECMREALAHLVGEHDFTSFTSPHSTQPNHVRTILDARIEVEHGADEQLYSNEAYDRRWDEANYPGKRRGIVHLYVTGTGFLYNMVRIIAGTLIEVGEGKRAPDELAVILAARDRAKAGPTAVPQGLILWEVEYADLKPGQARKTT